MTRKRGPAIHVETDGGAEIQIVLVHEDGTEIRLPQRTPAEGLLIAMDRTYSEYRRKITKLEDDHSLLEGDGPFGPRLAYSPVGLYELYVIELILYFQQERQRIVRCENCWRYFIPKTKKETLYCDRVQTASPARRRDRIGSGR